MCLHHVLLYHYFCQLSFRLCWCTWFLNSLLRRGQWRSKLVHITCVCQSEPWHKKWRVNVKLDTSGIRPESDITTWLLYIGGGGEHACYIRDKLKYVIYFSANHKVSPFRSSGMVPYDLIMFIFLNRHLTVFILISLYTAIFILFCNLVSAIV